MYNKSKHIHSTMLHVQCIYGTKLSCSYVVVRYAIPTDIIHVTIITGGHKQSRASTVDRGGSRKTIRRGNTSKAGRLEHEHVARMHIQLFHVFTHVYVRRPLPTIELYSLRGTAYSGYCCEDLDSYSHDYGQRN